MATLMASPGAPFIGATGTAAGPSQKEADIVKTFKVFLKTDS